MTIQKAIEAITDFREVAHGHAVLAEALDMAIDALQGCEKVAEGCEKVAEGCDDLISRQGAINKCRKRLYESAVNNVGYKCNADKIFVDIAENRIETWLNELPYAQPEPYIECQDCKYWDIEWTPSYSDGSEHYCPMIDLVTNEHFYCSYGEFIDEVIQ